MTFDQTHWVAVQRRGPLPTYYYHEHFVEMLDFVDEHYAHVFLDEHNAFIEDFRQLPADAQRLYVRLVNRKGRVFARNRLRYPELGSMQPLLEILYSTGWIGTPGEAHFEALLKFLTRSELYGVLLPRFPGLPRSLKKTQLVDFARANIAAEDLVASLTGQRILVQRRVGDLRYLLFLYFGRIRDGLAQFTMRDLGLVRTQSLHDSYEPRFSDRAEALEQFFFASELDALRRADAGMIAASIADLDAWPEPNFSGSARLRDELAFKAGKSLEKAGDADGALQYYLAGESAQCSERAIRLLLARGSRETALQHIERCLDNPRSDEEWLVAKDIYERKFGKKRTSDVTDMLRDGDQIDIDESQSGSPERAVIGHFEALGITAFRSENLLWRTLFGLLFWDELFDERDSALASPFEFLPVSLSNGTFYEQRRADIEAKLALLEDPSAAKRIVLRTSTRHYGTANGLFRWRRSMNEAVMQLLDHAAAESTAAILRAMARDYAGRRYGYPDLMLVDGGDIRFVEVKAEGDQLRRNQLLRIRQLREAGFQADVVRVRWVLDPNQAYVVVDVETTGGRGERHRVTEIGAVKVQGGEIVDRFETLLNPERPIPANITRLTGITPAMVQDAPIFADVIDKFEAFMRDAIFVAHNVEFDYGFISREFARLGRPFRHAKLCTCAALRKLEPGQKSYSLAALCRRYDIPLRQHHRALCDAEAAAQLLLIINERRRGNQ